MDTRQTRLRIVLVAPQDSRNIGSVCRAMKTMGLNSLYIVGSRTLDRAQAELTAVHARDVLDRAVFCSELGEAIRDSVLVAGVTRRRGRRRKYFALSPEQLAERLASISSGCCAVVFGNESSGLSDRELAQCHLAVEIPSSPEFPSLNLSHAVQVIAYLIFRRLSESRPSHTFQPISNAELEALAGLIVSALGNIGFFSQGDPAELARFWRDIMARAALEQREAERLAAVFSKISGMIAGKGVRDGAP